MPDESCRYCGGMLLVFSICAKCRESNQSICRICGTITLQQYHDQCFNGIRSEERIQIVEA